MHEQLGDAGVPLGIIHRDVSPSNVIIANAGMVKLIDFGIAKAMSSARTSAGLIKGKFGYIAPEYTRGQLDCRADLFAIGVIAHELLTGKRLFRGDSDFATLVAVRECKIHPPSHTNAEVSADLDDIVMTALQRDPAMRWRTAGAMRTALAEAARSLGVVVGSQRIREWAGGEDRIETIEASLYISEPSIIVELTPAEPTISLHAPSPSAEPCTTPATQRVGGRTRFKAAPLVAVAAFVAISVAAWQAWSALVVWSAGG